MACSSNSAHPSVPLTEPPGTIDMRLPTRHGGEPATLTARASTQDRSSSSPGLARGSAWPVGCAPVSPARSSSACGRTGNTASRLSRTPAGLPGRFRISVPPRLPATARDSAAIGVVSRPAVRISSARPGASRSITALVASGVTSRGPKPVPPEVTTRRRPWSTRDASRASIAGRSSGTDERPATSKPALRSISSAASPDSSVRVPAVTPSDTVSTAARNASPMAISCQTEPANREETDGGLDRSARRGARRGHPELTGDRGAPSGGPGRGPSRRAPHHAPRDVPPRLGGGAGARRRRLSGRRLPGSARHGRVPPAGGPTRGGLSRQATAWPVPRHRSSLEVRPMDDWQPPETAPPSEGPLLDTFGRVADDLRISVTDRCNFRCVFCMPAEGLKWLPKDEILTFEELTRLLGIFVSLGVRSIKVTGGEPTVRADLPTRVSMFRAAEDADLTPIKINCVVIGGENQDEVVDFATWARQTGYVVRFIEYMPLDAEHAWERAKVVPSRQIVDAIDRVFPLAPEGPDNEPAATYRFADGAPGGIGVIASVTEPFCETCNRLRLTAEGQVRSCLFALEELDLREPLRGGATDGELASIIRTAAWRKWSGHRINHPDFVQPDRSMSMIGG